MSTRRTVPTYLRVADRLEAQIARRSAGSPIASENELARHYDVSRLTARAALEELERRYLVRRAQGRGTFVAERIDYPIGPAIAPSWTQKVKLAGGEPRTETDTLKMRPIPRAAALALGTEPGARGYFLARRRYLGDAQAAYSETWLAADLVPALDEHLPANGSLFEALRDRYRLDPHAGAMRAEFVVATPAIAKKLGATDARPMVFALFCVTRARKRKRPVEVTTSWLRADSFRVVFEIGTDD